MASRACNLPSIRVALVEDDATVRDGLALLIGSAPGFICVAACATAEDALARLPALAPEVVLMDIGLPGLSGIDCIRLLKREHSRMQILMLTVFEDHDRIYRSLSAGASGYLLKQTEAGRLLEAIAEVHAGGSPMSAQIARRVVEAFQRPPVENVATTDHLTVREQEIITHLAEGRLYKEIAEQLGLSVETIRTHLRNIYEKLHVRNRTEAVTKVFGKPGHLPVG